MNCIVQLFVFLYVQRNTKSKVYKKNLHKLNPFFLLYIFSAESDLVTVSHIKEHFKRKRPLDTSLFTPETRTETLQNLYDAAAKTPVTVMDEMDRLVGGRRRSSEAFLCTPVLGQIRRKMESRIDMEIEARMVSLKKKGKNCEKIFVFNF